ncbi:DUF4862 family protein [Cellulomonas cellasea]|uniref:UDP-N-acetylglucosamine diphosphorylase n=2 Tax=Cellulomonas cellasea TaxID=43670 RepID=A0A0A0B6P1_9CELL|nr:DUF4862 family protein [Cellulomonas cellasea]KGM01862.1 hypothetical protein Q760_16940 [Cellulomonas cellasea DSM 20118]GEA86517.1 DUF4862 domain-containing protein [Cellulomonas cellasea]
MTTPPNLFVSAYITAPGGDPEQEDAFFDAVAGLDIGGLEYGLAPEGARTLDPAWIAAHVLPTWDLVVTLVPTMMVRLGTEPAYGLASTDETQRARALADVARARDLARSLADTHGRRRVTAIEIHTAPGPVLGSREAFTRSLDEILTWDLAGAELLVEHCDAHVPGQTAAKGFFTLTEELEIVQGYGLAPDVLGMAVNWGRSAIEGRNPATAVEHTQAVADAGLLRALVLSGATDVDSAWGPAWTDMHIPTRGDAPALEASAVSLLGPDETAATLKAAADVPRIGLKYAVRPQDADVATRIAVLTATLQQVADARAAL